MTRRDAGGGSYDYYVSDRVWKYEIGKLSTISENMYQIGSFHSSGNPPAPAMLLQTITTDQFHKITKFILQLPLASDNACLFNCSAFSICLILYYQGQAQIGLDDVARPYNFNYEPAPYVKKVEETDPLTGRVRGSYTVADPARGRTKTVNYAKDEAGFRAAVQTTDPLGPSAAKLVSVPGKGN